MKAKILDDPKRVKRLDKEAVLASAELFPNQIKQAWEEVHQLKIKPGKYKKIKNIIVAGMGGSALGARLIDSLAFEILKSPLEIINGYHLPAYADKNSLVILSSYSGNTEETISCGQEVLAKKCPVLAITTGGRLAKMAVAQDWPTYLIKPAFNPSGHPRMGLGYSISGQMAFLSRLGFIRITNAMIYESLAHLRKIGKKINLTCPFVKNSAKKLAQAFWDKSVVFISSEHLIGATHVFKNMLNENSKTFAVRFSLPEMNHHLLEGLAFPKNIQKNLVFAFIESDVYDDKIKKRFSITRAVVTKNGFKTLRIVTSGRTRLSQTLETIYFSTFVSVYLAFLNKVDPGPIPWVDYFKRKLTAHEKEK